MGPPQKIFEESSWQLWSISVRKNKAHNCMQVGYVGKCQETQLACQLRCSCLLMSGPGQLIKMSTVIKLFVTMLTCLCHKVTSTSSARFKECENVLLSETEMWFLKMENSTLNKTKRGNWNLWYPDNDIFFILSITITVESLWSFLHGFQVLTKFTI